MYKVGRLRLLIIFLHTFLLGHNFAHTNVSLPPGTPRNILVLFHQKFKHMLPKVAQKLALLLLERIETRSFLSFQIFQYFFTPSKSAAVTKRRVIRIRINSKSNLDLEFPVSFSSLTSLLLSS